MSLATLYITIPANIPRPEAKRIFQFFMLACYFVVD